MILYLFGTKKELVDALVAHIRAEERARLYQVWPADGDPPPPLDVMIEDMWSALAAAEHRRLLVLSIEGALTSVARVGEQTAGCPHGLLEDWVGGLSPVRPSGIPEGVPGQVQWTLALAVLRGALLDLLCTGDLERTTSAVQYYAEMMRARLTGRTE